jgi:hypothetical protein
VSSAIATAAAINRVKDLTGVTAKANANVLVGTGFVTGSTSTTITATSIFLNGVTITANVTSDTTRADLANLINLKTGQTGVVASDNGDGLTLVAEDGRTISLGTDNSGAAATAASAGAAIGMATINGVAALASTSATTGGSIAFIASVTLQSDKTFIEGKNSKDVYSKEILDVLNLALTENKNDFICIIAGYKDDLQSSFFSFNDGLERRFPIRFSIEPYSGNELKSIFIKKVYELNWCIEDKAIDEKFIENNKHYFKFNGGDMEILLAKCKIAHSKNLLKYKDKIKKILTKEDFDYGFNIYLENPSIKNRINIDYKNNLNMYL